MNVLIDPAARPVVAPRGDCAHRPENTIASFEHAVSLGVDALEFDLRVTRDGAAVVMHDATVDRTTNGRGAVAAMTLGELRALDAGARFSADGGRTHPFADRGLVVPTFEEMLDRFRDLPFVIEVKVPEAVEETRRLVRRHDARRRVLLDSATHAAVTPFRDGEHLTGASLREALALLPFAALPAGPRRLAYEALFVPRRYHGVPVPVARLAAAARRAGVVTHVWTVNDVAGARRLWQAGVQGIVTDDPAAMLEVRASLGG